MIFDDYCIDGVEWATEVFVKALGDWRQVLCRDEVGMQSCLYDCCCDYYTYGRLVLKKPLPGSTCTRFVLRAALPKRTPMHLCITIIFRVCDMVCRFPLKRRVELPLEPIPEEISYYCSVFFLYLGQTEIDTSPANLGFSHRRSKPGAPQTQEQRRDECITSNYLRQRLLSQASPAKIII